MSLKGNLFLMAVSLIGMGVDSMAQSKVYRGDNRGLPKIDLAKEFDTKSFSGFDRSFEAKSIEVGAVNLPTYSGNLKTLPSAEWNAPKAVVYDRSIEAREFEVQKLSEKWSRPSGMGGTVDLAGRESSMDGRPASIPAEPLDFPEVSTPRSIEGQDLLRLINRGGGREMGPVKYGRGFGAVNLGGKATAKPETKSLPKWEPSR